MSSKSSTKSLTHIQALITGIQTPGLLPANFAMPISGTEYTSTTLVTKLQGFAQPMSQYVDAKAASKTAEQAATAALGASKPFVDQLDQGMKVALGPSNPLLAKLDIKPQAPRKPLTADQNLQRKLKAKATREARGTLGPKQKKAIKVTSVPPTTLVVDDTGVHEATASSSSGTAPTGTAPAASAVKPPAGS